MDDSTKEVLAAFIAELERQQQQDQTPEEQK